MSAEGFEQTGDLLIIGYGNELRSDDGVGPRVASAVARWDLTGVRVLICHQLTPELAIPIAAASQVVFVDAAKESASVQTREVAPAPSGQIMTHAVDPQALLQLAKMLYHRYPRAWWLTIPAENFGFGDELSDACRQGMQTAIDRIRLLVEGRSLAKAKTAARTRPAAVLSS